MKRTISALVLILSVAFSFGSFAQSTTGGTIIQGTITSATDKETLIGVSVTELDANNRVVGQTITDINGHYVLKAKSLQNRLSVSYIGYTKQIVNISNKTVVNIVLVDNTQSLKTVEVVASRKQNQGGYSIPTREIGTAMQTIDMKEIEGLQVSSVDEALQGRIAGLDIVANSGDPGSGTAMRIRGVTSITGNSQPLIVVNNVPFESQVDPNFDFANSNQEQYANMLSINPDDILEITVLKDAGASAIWGSKGANGVLMITTKKGIAGPTRVDYTYRYTRTVQPKGLNMLNGGDFTMLMKQSYFNVAQDENANNIDEYNYNQNFPEYQNFNNSTDWVKAVTQVGNISDHYITLSGGGERASYRVSGGFFKQNGTVIGQELSRVSTRAYLEYKVSDRIKFISEFSLTNSDNARNYDNLLGIAYKKMPNVSIYAQDAAGNDTKAFYNISRSSALSDEQKDLYNPVALGTLAVNRLKSLRILPTFRLQFDLLDPNKQVLRYNMFVSFDMNNNKTSMFLPQEVSNRPWNNVDKSRGTSNKADNSDSESLSVFGEQNLAWEPKFTNKDHSLLLYGSMQVTVGSSSSQGIGASSLPSFEAPVTSGVGTLDDGSTSHSTWRSLAFMARTHYSYKGRYIFDATLRREGSTRFGQSNRFGNFPGVNLKYIISDEPFMKPLKKVVSMLAVRPAWGISGNQPSEEYLFYSLYENYGSYIGQAAIKPKSLKLDNLKWESTNSFNYGLDLGLFNDKYVFDINFYNKRTSDLLFKDVAVSETSGFGVYNYINGGIMDNDGWEVNFYATKFYNSKDFSIDFKFNLSNYKNTLIDLEDKILEAKNADFTYKNGEYLTRVQKGNSFGSIYGFRYKGVYQYDKYTDEHTNAPVAKDASGKVIVDEYGKPKPMYFGYGVKGVQYQFRGGDAMYEDINHDGNIDELDIVYLGTSNPKLNGGFGPTFRYKNLSCNMFFNFRLGNKIVNAARMNAENMYYDNNQSTAVNWRWRVDGDNSKNINGENKNGILPRALHKTGYNWLGSDRFVEDGSFLRFKYLTFNYTVPSKMLKKYGVQKASIYLTFNNLFVLTRYSGVDPEVGYGNLDTDGGLSIDNSSTPRSKDFTLGVSVGL
ncbi:MAG TPA: SusC/RagA family TonB-linked outer membrane protein [Paludibacter sp.]|nr:SusC/RagA family TonB-linked outer membrane protein [Paludibacter sp.]